MSRTASFDVLWGRVLAKENVRSDARFFKIHNIKGSICISFRGFPWRLFQILTAFPRYYCPSRSFPAFFVIWHVEISRTVCILSGHFLFLSGPAIALGVNSLPVKTMYELLSCGLKVAELSCRCFDLMDRRTCNDAKYFNSALNCVRKLSQTSTIFHLELKCFPNLLRIAMVVRRRLNWLPSARTKTSRLRWKSEWWRRWSGQCFSMVWRDGH